MKLTPLKIFALKLAIFSSMLAYMAIDLFLWHGPIWQALHTEDTPGADHSAALAQVYGEPITEKQLERYIAEQNWLKGRSDTTPSQRTAMLMDLVRGTILRMRARYNDKNLPDFTAAAEEEVQRLASRATDAAAFDRQLAAQGYTRQSFTQKLQAIMKAAALLDRAAQPFCQVSDEDVAKHYELLKHELVAPARRPLKHIFFSTLGQDSDRVRARAQAVLLKLESNESDFAALARQLSEDARTAPQGGDLGTVVNDESNLLPELQLFGESALPAGKYTLAHSRWGWHILLPGEITPARTLTPDEVRESLRTAIQSSQYELAVQNFIEQAVRESFSKKHLQIYHAQ